MTLSFENPRLKKITPIDVTGYFVEGYAIPPKAYNAMYAIGKKKLEESDPMTILAEEAKALARDARSALFPNLPEGGLGVGDSDPITGDLFGETSAEESTNISAPESLTKTDIHDEIVRPKPKPKPKRSLKDSGVKVGDLKVAQIVESILMCSRSPMTSKKIALGIKDITEAEVEEAIEELNTFYLETARSFRVYNIAGGFQIRTDALFEPWLKEVFVKQKTDSITPAGNETLAIVAYKQPITKVEIDNIRGVDSGGHVRNLMEKELVEVCGKSSELGNPNFYGTTKKFLELYGLNTIEELPSIEDIKEMA
jgi:segregation and condensation protein B